jgi:hypothetical protein
MADTKFFEEITFLFESYLSPKRDRLKINVKDLTQDKVLEDMNYDKVFFDSELNIYKITKEGKLQRVDNENFEAVVMKQN